MNISSLLFLYKEEYLQKMSQAVESSNNKYISLKNFFIFNPNYCDVEGEVRYSYSINIQIEVFNSLIFLLILFCVIFCMVSIRRRTKFCSIIRPSSISTRKWKMLDSARRLSNLPGTIEDFNSIILVVVNWKFFEWHPQYLHRWQQLQLHANTEGHSGHAPTGARFRYGFGK